MSHAERPSTLIAALCGALAPGAGLFYAGRWRLALGVLVAFMGIAVVVPLVVVDRGIDLARLPALIVAASLSLWVPALVFGAVAAMVAPASSGPRPPWRHPWWVFGFVLVTHAGASIARGQMAAHVVTVVAVDRQLPRLQLDPPTAFVIARRGFDPASLVAGELVGVAQQAQVQIGRVASTDGDALLVDLGAGDLLAVARGDVVGRAVLVRR